MTLADAIRQADRNFERVEQLLTNEVRRDAGCSDAMDDRLPRGILTHMPVRRAHPSLCPALICLSLAAALLLWLVALQGCSSWQATAKTTLTVAEAAIDGANKVGLDYYHRRCMTVAASCPAGTDDRTCAPLGECWGARRLLQAVLDRSSLAVSAAWAVLVAADETGTTQRLVAVQAAIADLGQLLAGVVP